MSFYSDLQETVTELFTEYGVVTTLRPYYASPGGYNPSTQSSNPPGIDGAYDENRVGILADAPGSRLAQQFGNTYGLATQISRMGKWVYIDGPGTIPKVGDHLIVETVDYAIIDVQMIGPGGIPLMYLIVLES